MVDDYEVHEQGFGLGWSKNEKVINRFFVRAYLIKGYLKSNYINFPPPRCPF